MTYKNWHKLFGGIANEQGIEVGSPLWLSGGAQAYGGSTGAQANYGWRFDHLCTNDWIKAVVANYGHRRIYYDEAPKRQVSYEAGGRPINWMPEDDLDMIDGKVAYSTSKGIVAVSGPDLLHFHLGPLFVLWDKDSPVMAQGNIQSGKALASMMIKYFIGAMTGEFRDSSSPMFMGDRGSSNIIKAAVEAAKRDLIFDEDKPTITNWLLNNCLPFYESAPGLKTGVKGYGGFQLYNGLYWLLPSFYDLYLLLPDSDLKDRIYKIVQRMSQWMADLQTLKSDMDIANVDIVDQTIFTLPEAPQSILPYVKLADTTGQGTDWSLWAMRAEFVAAEVLGSAVLKAAAEANCAKWKTKQIPSYKYTKQDKAWIVGADGEYL